MSILERHGAYADAFVESWEDAVRAPDFETPTVDGVRLTICWGRTDRQAAAPAPMISVVDTAVLEAQQLVRLRDGFDTAAETLMAARMPVDGGS